MDVESPTPGCVNTLGPALFSTSDTLLLGTDNSPAMARHHFTHSHSSVHARHQSVPLFSSPQNSPQAVQQQQQQPSSSRGLAKLTLVERLSRESIENPSSGENGLNSSPKTQSLVRFDEGSPRPTHSPRRSRMSLSIPPTKTATTPISAASPLTSPLRPASFVMPSPTKHISNGSLSEINLSPTHGTHERAMTSPSLSSLEEVSALDDANATFLTLIAFQERRVVELREELARAESELDLLKQQWTRQQLKLARTDRQEHIRQNSLTKLEQQMSSTHTGTPRPGESREEMQSPQILVAGKRLAEGVRDGFFSVMQDLKSVAVNESAQTTPRQRGRSPTRRMREELGLGIVSEKKTEPPLWYPKNSSPKKRSPRRESDGSDTSQETSTTLTSTRTSSMSSAASDIKSPTLNPSTPPLPSSTTRSPDPSLSPWTWTMASRILTQSQRHATTLFATVERHLDALAAGPEPPLHPRRARRLPSGHLRTETVQF